MELALDDLRAGLRREEPVRHADGKGAGHRLHLFHGKDLAEGLAHEDLARVQLDQLVLQGLVGILTPVLRDGGLAGRDIAVGEREAVLLPDDGGEVVVFLLTEHRLLRQRAGGHDADDLPPDETLGQLGVLHLLADGHLVAALDEARDVSLRGMERDSAHGSPFVLSAVLARQRQLQLLGGELGVVVEHLIEVAQAKEEDAIPVLGFQVHILLHHG